MAVFQPPPTWAEVVITDPATNKARFNPIWLKWFVDLIGILNAAGGGSGAILHNNTGSLQGGTANQFYHLTAAQHVLVPSLAAGTYTPTLTNVTNLAASTAYQAQYMQMGATVVVSGRMDVDPTAGGLCQLGITLPVASNIGALEDVGGTAFASGIAGQGAAIRGDAANNRAEMAWIAVDVTNQPMYFIFAYQVI